MKMTHAVLFCALFAALPAAALDKQFVDDLMQSAKNIEREATIVSDSLKTKRIDTEGVKAKINAMGTDVQKLQELVAQFEATHPSMSERDQADWKMLKEKVQLLEIFHQQKKRLAEADLQKNRSLIRAHATGVASRAKRLQQTAVTLQRGPVS